VPWSLYLQQSYHLQEAARRLLHGSQALRKKEVFFYAYLGCLLHDCFKQGEI
jgi:hypothetical protein